MGAVSSVGAGGNWLMMQRPRGRSRWPDDLINDEPREFKAHLRLKPCLWLGCRVSGHTGSPSGWPMLRFDNFPWLVLLDRTTGNVLCRRKWGERENWPQEILAADLVPVGTMFNIRVKERLHDDICRVDTRIIL